MSQIWSIFKQMFEDTINFQTNFEKYPQGAAAPWGRRRRRRLGYFFKICLKMERIFKHLFENGPYLAHPTCKVAIMLFFSNFHHLEGDASYQSSMALKNNEQCFSTNIVQDGARLVQNGPEPQHIIV